MHFGSYVLFIGFWYGVSCCFSGTNHQLMMTLHCVCVCVCARVRACMHACVRACVHACVLTNWIHGIFNKSQYDKYLSVNITYIINSISRILIYWSEYDDDLGLCWCVHTQCAYELSRFIGYSVSYSFNVEASMFLTSFILFPGCWHGIKVCSGRKHHRLCFIHHV